jgi:Domain of unknown function (DUF4288)
MNAAVPKSRFAAMLLFQFRVVSEGRSNQRRTCERRLIVFEAKDAPAALRHANRHGRKAEHSYPNSTDSTIHFEFVGVPDLLKLGPECGPDEVWFDVVAMVRPMERRDRLFPPESELQAIAARRR